MRAPDRQHGAAVVLVVIAACNADAGAAGSGDAGGVDGRVDAPREASSMGDGGAAADGTGAAGSGGAAGGGVAGEGGIAGAAMDASADALPRGPTFAPTFSAIYREIFVPADCTLGLCHGAGANAGGLKLFPRADAYTNLVGVLSTSPECGASGLALVEPGAPDASLLALKLEAAPPCGDPMPPQALLDPRHVEQVREWIRLGANDD